MLTIDGVHVRDVVIRNVWVTIQEKLMSRYIDTTQMVSAANELSVFQHIVNRCYELLDELPTTMEGTVCTNCGLVNARLH